LLIVISFAALSASLLGSFVWDDINLITMQIHNLGGLSLFRSGGFYYRPVVGVTFLLDFLIWHWSPLGYHLSNVILHTLCVLLVFQLIKIILNYHSKIKNKHIPAFFTAALFAVHPIHTESVAWIAGRTDISATLFFLLAFLTYVLFRQEKRPVALVLSFVFFLFSVGSKFIGISFPMVVILYELVLNRNKKGAFFCLVYGIPFLVYIAFRAHSLHLAERIVRLSLKGMTVAHSLKLFFSSLWFYLVKSFWFIPQNAFIGEVPRLYHPIAGFIVLLLLTLAVVKLDGRRLIGFWLAFFFVTLLPSLIPVYIKVVSTPLAERYLYLPSITACFLVPYVVASLTEGQEVKRGMLYTGTVILLTLITLTGGIASAKRTLIWRNEIALWGDTVKKSPQFGKVHDNYGAALMNAGRWDEAEREFRVALSPKTVNTITGRSNACVNLGNLHTKRGEYDKAERAYKAALRFWHGNAVAYYNLGYLYFLEAIQQTNGQERLRLLSLSRDALRKALDINGSFIAARLLLGKLYYYLGDRLKSLKEFETLIKEAPERREAKEARAWIRKIYKGM
jgi:hypothetical protein